MKGNFALWRGLAFFVVVSGFMATCAEAEVVPEILGPWKYNLCQPTSYVSAYVRECVVWDVGTWVSFTANPAYANMQGPRPWSDESKLIPKAIAYYSGISATPSGWLAPGQRFGYNGCASGPPQYENGVEISNAEEIHVTTSSGSDALAVAIRFRDYVCPTGSVKNSLGQCELTGPDPKTFGCSGSGSNSQVGDPCDAGTGNEFQFDTDYQGASGTLSFTRAYNSLDTNDHGLGFGWVSNVDRHLTISGDSLRVYQSDGQGLPFTLTNGVWQGDADSKLQLTQSATGYTLQRQDGRSERYNLQGRLLSETDRAGRTTTYTYDSSNQVATVTGPFGHTLSFTYDGSGRLASLTDPAGQVTHYSYDAAGNLAQVNYPDGTAKQYSYTNRSFPHALTGVAFVDTSGNVTPFDNFVYDANGKVATNELAGGQQRFDLSYDSDTQTTVTNAAGRKDVLTFQTQLGVKNLLSKIVQADGKGLTQQFDDRNNVISRTNADGQTTQYTYDDQNRLISETEAAGTPQAHTVSYQYGSDGLALPVEIDRPSVCSGSIQKTQISYDANHNPTQITETGYTPSCSAITRRMSLSYNAAGQVNRIDGPRTDFADISTLSYHDCTAGGACGQLQSTTDALDHTTTFDAYDANGRLLQKTDPNGLVTQYTYDPRGRLSQISAKADGGTARVTAFSYTPSGKLARTTLPDGRSLSYSYNDAQELTTVTDTLGDKIGYTYDSRGNRSQTSTYDPDGTLISQRTREDRDVGQRDYLWTDTAPIARIDGSVGEAKVHKDWLPQVLMGFLHHHEDKENDRAARLYYFHADAMGTPRLATDAKQRVVWRWNEDAFGEKVSADRNQNDHRDHDWDHGRPHGIQVNLRYPSQYYDTETGLHYNYFRTYDPNTGRYLTSDPIGLSGGINTYTYVDNNPLKYIDPYGLSKFDKLYGLPKQFWNWYHRKEKRPGNPDLTKDEARDLYKEWQDRGKPKPDSKGKQDGFVDPDLLEWLIPWPLIPSELGCGELDCNHNGIPDHEEENQCK